MLKPKRLCGRLFAFTKAVKWELERRFPARYTASNCAFCTSRASRGYFCPDLLGRKAMASLLAASRQDFPAAYGLHARAKSVRFGAAALARLKCALWQSNPPLRLRVTPGKSFTKAQTPADWPLPRLFSNLQVYLPLARRVKKTKG